MATNLCRLELRRLLQYFRLALNVHDPGLQTLMPLMALARLARPLSTHAIFILVHVVIFSPLSRLIFVGLFPSLNLAVLPNFLIKF